MDRQSPPNLGGVLDGFCNGEGVSLLFSPFSLVMRGGGPGGIPCPLPSAPRQPSPLRLPPRRKSGAKTHGGLGPSPRGPGPQTLDPKPLKRNDACSACCAAGLTAGDLGPKLQAREGSGLKPLVPGPIRVPTPGSHQVLDTSATIMQCWSCTVPATWLLAPIDFLHSN